MREKCDAEAERSLQKLAALEAANADLEHKNASLQQHILQLRRSNAEWNQRHNALLQKHGAEAENWRQEHSALEETVASLRRCDSQQSTALADDLHESQELANQLTAYTSFLQDKLQTMMEAALRHAGEEEIRTKKGEVFPHKCIAMVRPKSVA